MTRIAPSSLPDPNGKSAGAGTVSFVIPALNEERNIGQTLRAIRCFMADRGEYEVIVADHGSRDRTAEIARECGASVYQQRGGTIASLRNLGARQARGDVLVFLDADVELTPAWSERFPHTLASLHEQPALLTGSHCSAPPDGTWIERYWFRHFASEQNVSHIGTGHLIVTRETFLKVGGFDERLETGEDYEFCRRVARAGGVIVNDPGLEVIHREFPKNLIRFMRREAWHGRGDLRSWREFLGSKVAVAAALFVLMHVGLVLSPLFGPVSVYVAIVILAGIAGLLFASAVFKYWHSPWPVILVNAFIYYFYYLGRSLSFVLAAWRALAPRRGSRHR